MGSRRKRRWRSRLARGAVGGGLIVLAVTVWPTPALAGGSWLKPTQDRYEPGDDVTLVGYVSGGGSLGSVDDAPFFAYLSRPAGPAAGPFSPPLAPFTPAPSDLPLGEMTVEYRGGGGYLDYRVSVAFTLPPDLPAGRYGVAYCNASCTKGLSDLIGGIVYVGLDPEAPILREWPVDEPTIVDLDDDAILSGPGWQVRAAEARAGAAPQHGVPVPTVPEPTTSAPAAPADTVAARAAARPELASEASRGPAWTIAAVLVLVIMMLAFVARAELRRR